MGKDEILVYYCSHGCVSITVLLVEINRVVVEDMEALQLTLLGCVVDRCCPKVILLQTCR